MSAEVFLLKSDIDMQDTCLQDLGAKKHIFAQANLDLARDIAKQTFHSIPEKVDCITNAGTFHALYLIHYPDRKYILKKLIDDFNNSKQTLQKEKHILQLLTLKEIQEVTIYSSDDDFLLMDYIDGQPIQDDQLSILGSHLANLHELEITNDTSIPNPNWQEYLLTNLEQHLKICQDLQYLTQKQSTQILKLFVEPAINITAKTSSLLHGDLNRSNILVTQDQQLVLLDWEDTMIGDPIFDLANWGSFINNHSLLPQLLAGYDLPFDEAAEYRYWLYYLRIILAKSVHRYRFGYSKSDKLSAADRILFPFNQLMGF